MSIVRRKVFGLPLYNGLLRNDTQPRCVTVAAPRCSGGRPCYPGYNTIRTALRDHKSHLADAKRNREKVVRKVFAQYPNRTSSVTDQNLEVITERTGIPGFKAKLLDRWTWDRYRSYCFPIDTAQILGYQETHGGNMSNMPIHLVESEQRMIRNFETETEPSRRVIPPKLTQIGKVPTEDLITALCLMGEDRLIRGFVAFEKRNSPTSKRDRELYQHEFVQLANFASWWFEVATHMGSTEAALFLTRIVTHPVLKAYWNDAGIVGPTLELPRKVIEAEVTENAQSCGWPEFSAYMDLFYSPEDLRRTSDKGDVQYLLLGIHNMLYRIKRNLFESVDSDDHQPRVYPPHKHLLRIVEHCLKRKNLVLPGFPRQRLMELRETMLQELAEDFDDREANFTLAIRNGDWTSPDFKQYFSKAYPTLIDIQHHGDDLYSSAHHAIWLSILQQLQEAGYLEENPGSALPAANSLSDSFSDESVQDALQVLETIFLPALMYEADIAESQSTMSFYNRTMAATAIIKRFTGQPYTAIIHLGTLIDYVTIRHSDLERKPRLRDQVRKLRQILDEDFGMREENPMIRWSDAKIDDILQRFADPTVIVRDLQKQTMK